MTIQETILKLRTIGLISTLVLGLLATPLPAEAQQAGKVYRIGFLRYSRGPSLPIPATLDYGNVCASLGMLKDRTMLLSTVPQKVSANGSPT